MTPERLEQVAKLAGLCRDGDVWYSRSKADMDVTTADLQRLVSLAEKEERERLAGLISRMPFGDTAASFATWLRDMK